MEPTRLEGIVRRCLYRDLDQILPIYNYYVSRTIASLDQDTRTAAYLQSLYNSVLDQDLPFLVVTLNDDRKAKILGYAYASNFRQLPAFGGTVEILIYLDRDATGHGIGKNLLTVLMGMLRAVGPGPGREQGIKEVLALVPVREGRDASGFFLKHGFKDRGTLRRVGWKMGRWVDTRYLQRSLNKKPREQVQPVPTSLSEQPRDQEQPVQAETAPTRHWWSSLFHRGRRRRRRAR